MTKLDMIVSEIPESRMEEASEKFIDFVLYSKNGKKIPSEITKALLYHWQRDQLKTPAGIQLLLEAACIAEPDKTFAYLNDELGLEEEMFKSAMI